MIFRLRPSTAPLDPFVENLWFHQGYSPDHVVEKLLPDGGVELIFDLTAVPKRLHDRERPWMATRFRRGWLSGMQREYLLIGPGRESSMCGVRFRPGGIAPFLPAAAKDIAERVVELDLVWGPAIWRLRDALIEAATPDAKFDLLTAWLIDRASSLEADRLLPEALRRLQATSGPMTIAGLSADLGVTQRRLIELFDRRVGLKPKVVHRVFRFMRAVQLVEGADAVDWADLALDCGFHDQAHFVKEFRAFAGLTPTEYFSRRTEYPFWVAEDADAIELAS